MEPLVQGPIIAIGLCFAEGVSGFHYRFRVGRDTANFVLGFWGLLCHFHDDSEGLLGVFIPSPDSRVSRFHITDRVNMFNGLALLSDCSLRHGLLRQAYLTTVDRDMLTSSRSTPCLLAKSRTNLAFPTCSTGSPGTPPEYESSWLPTGWPWSASIARFS